MRYNLGQVNRAVNGVRTAGFAQRKMAQRHQTCPGVNADLKAVQGHDESATASVLPD